MRRAFKPQRHFPFRVWLVFILLCSYSYACAFPAYILKFIPNPAEPTILITTQSLTSPVISRPTTRSTPSPVPTLKSTQTPSPTVTSTPSPTIPPTKTATPEIRFSAIPQLPSYTPGSNQITIGQQVWQLESVDTPRYISALGRLYSPPTRRDPSTAYVFLRINFECTSGQSLIQGYIGSDLGLSFVHKQSGYSDLSIQDMQGHKYLVTLLGACWLAAPIPETRAGDRDFILQFKGLPPFYFKTQPVEKQIISDICFVSDKDGTQELFTAQPDGSKIERLTTDFSQASEPAWSPDHLEIAYVTYRSGNAEIQIIDTLGVRISTIASSPYDEGGPDWSPNGEQISFHTQRDGNWEIYSSDINIDQPTNHTQHPADDMYPSWSPEGKRLAFQSDRNGGWQIFVMDADGSGLELISSSAGEDILPSWSPDGKSLLYWSRQSGQWRLYLHDLENHNFQALTNYVNPGSPMSRAAWSPDGKSVIISLHRERFLQLYRLELDKGEPFRIIDIPANFFMPAW